jgi:hypothetical protein
MCPICPPVGSVLVRVPGPGRGGLVKSGQIRAGAWAVTPELARQLYRLVAMTRGGATVACMTSFILNVTFDCSNQDSSPGSGPSHPMIRVKRLTDQLFPGLW